MALPIEIFVTDAAGNPINGARVFHYEAGTFSPKAVFTTADLDVALPQGFSLPNGRGVYFLGAGAYRRRVTTADGVDLPAYALDNIATDSVAEDLRTDLAATDSASTGAGQVGFSEDLSYPVNTVGRKLSAIRAWPKNNRVALLGDSIMRDGLNNTATETQNANRGFTHWIPFLTSQRFVSPQSLNFGVSGENSAQIASRVQSVIDSGAGVCLVCAGTNDIGGFTPAQTIANLAIIYDRLAKANVLILALPILPRTLSVEAQFSHALRVNEWIREQATLYAGFKLIIPLEFADQFSLTYSARSGYSWDGLHPTAIGAFSIARPAAEYLNTLAPHPGMALYSVCDFFTSTNPRGYINANPLLGGSGGTKGSGVTGDVADSWRVQKFDNGGSVASLTVACSKGAAARTGGVNQRIQVGGTATGGFDTSVIFDLPVSFASNLTAGDTIEMLADVEVAGATIGVSGVAAYLAVEQSGVFRTVNDGLAIVSDDYLWRDIPEARFRTPPLTLSGTLGATQCGIKIYLKNIGTTRSIDLRINNVVVRKVLP